MKPVLEKKNGRARKRIPRDDLKIIIIETGSGILSPLLTNS